ncbi:cohesin domain-containing protein [Natronolimnobius baerhuensis]|uniref:Cohesin domain-containing protein n=1 Tax=Natronolimnobius baerhuensis TaxID=253108 RepID=A0A202E6N1_9EURY|nr:cohesin domain-containing protein [Natronolimnobius baerhuensis]OVE83922.1 hypothetical protein B2G88_16050 [Natronolimnobius baerhuensis]
MDSTGRIRDAVVAGALIAGLLVAFVGAGIGPVSAADQVAIVWAEPEEQTVAPGETLDLEVVLQSEGGHGDAGLERITLVGQYDPAVLEVTAVERGPWLEGEDGADVDTAGTIAHENGTVILEQERDGGATGIDTLATLTLQVAEDAPATTTAVEFGASEASLENDWPIAVIDDSPTVTVDADTNDDTAGEFEHPDPGQFELEEGFGSPTESTAGAIVSWLSGPTWLSVLGAGVIGAVVAVAVRAVGRRDFS